MTVMTIRIDRFSARHYLETLKGQGKTPDTAITYCGGNDIPVNLSVQAVTVRKYTLNSSIDLIDWDTIELEGTADGSLVTLPLTNATRNFTVSMFV